MVNKKQVVSSDDTNVVAKKRGRKSKKDIELAQQELISKTIMQNNINVIIEESNIKQTETGFDDLLNNTSGDSDDNEIITMNTNIFSTSSLVENENNVHNDNDRLRAFLTYYDCN